MYLLDTNIFLEILLNQEKSSHCKAFLTKNYDKVFISDFSLHSIGIILFKYNKKELFEEFIQDILSVIKILNLPFQGYHIFKHINKLPELDFDDLYQYTLAKYFDLVIVTLDSDFRKIKDVKIKFL